MELINAGLLGFAALAALPVIIHLMQKPRPKSQPFPSLIFLQHCARRSRALSRLRDILLMVLRAAAVAGIAFALARPRLAGAAQAGDDGVAAAIVVDDSFRMRYHDSGIARFDTARSRIMDVLATLPPGTPTALVLASGESSVLLPDPAPLRGEVLRIQAGERSEPLLPAILDAARILEDEPSRRHEIHVFTDLSISAWTGAAPQSLQALQRTTIYVHDVGREKPHNFAVTKVEIVPRAPQAGRPIEIVATVAAWGEGGNVTVALQYGDQRLERVVAVAAGDKAVLRFHAVAPHTAVAHGMVRLTTPDPLSLDNDRHFAAPVNASIRALILEAPDAIPYASFALSPPSLTQHRPILATIATSPTSLRDLDAAVVTDPATLTSDHAHMLADFARQGGGLILFSSTLPAALATLASAGLAPVCEPGPTLADPLRMRDDSSAQVTLPGFRGGRNGDLSGPEFTRRLTVKADARWRAILNFTDGAPAALEAQIGRGRIVFFPFAIDGGTDLAKRPCFVPLLHELVRRVGASAAASDSDARCGVPVILDLQQRATETSGTLTNLASGAREPRTIDVGARALTVARSLPAGRYAVDYRAESGPRTRAFSVNVDPVGGDTTRTDADGIRKILAGATVLFTYEQGAAARVRENRAGRELTTGALIAVAILLLAEVLIASRA